MRARVPATLIQRTCESLSIAVGAARCSHLSFPLVKGRALDAIGDTFIPAFRRKGVASAIMPPVTLILRLYIAVEQKYEEFCL